jgi:hypothetical protein
LLRLPYHISFVSQVTDKDFLNEINEASKKVEELENKLACWLEENENKKCAMQDTDEAMEVIEEIERRYTALSSSPQILVVLFLKQFQHPSPCINRFQLYCDIVGYFSERLH